MNKEMVEQIYLRNFGSESYYQRSYCDNLKYTEGIMDFQKSLNAFWIVDCTISHLQKIYGTSKSVDDRFFIIEINVDEKSNSGIFEIFREGYINNKYDEHITVLKQTIPDINLVEFDYKFYLILTSNNPVEFILLLWSEY